MISVFCYFFFFFREGAEVTHLVLRTCDDNFVAV